MLEILPIALTVVDWPTYLAATQKLLGQSVSATIDRYKLRQDLTSFIVSLGEFEDSKATVLDPQQTLREAGSLLKHGAASFMVLAPGHTLSQLREKTELAVTSVQGQEILERVAVVSGNLYQWRNAVLELSVEKATHTQRAFANKVMSAFEAAGLGQLWNGFIKTPMADKTYRLEHK